MSRYGDPARLTTWREELVRVEAELAAGPESTYVNPE